MFEVNDNIENLKTGKIGKVTKVYKEEGIFRYHLLNTPNNIHVGFISENRFKLKEKNEK